MIDEIETLDKPLESNLLKSKHYITSNELADCIGLNIQTVYKYFRSHNIETILTSNKRRMVPFNSVRKIFLDKGFVYPNQNISFQIVKGGVGKTSLSFSLAVRANHYGTRVLAIDMDQQANLTRSFNVDARDKPVWLNLFREKIDVSEAIINISDGLDLIPSSLKNSRLDMELTQANVNLPDMIKDILKKVRQNYDLVIFDCPPAINKVNTAVTCASDLIIVPMNPDPYAMDGIDFTISELKSQKSNFKLNFDFKLLWNRYDSRERLSSYYMHEVAKERDYFNYIIPVVIRSDTSLKNSIFYEKNIFDLPKSNVREDVDQLAREIIGLNAWKERGFK